MNPKSPFLVALAQWVGRGLIPDLLEVLAVKVSVIAPVLRRALIIFSLLLLVPVAGVIAAPRKVTQAEAKALINDKRERKTLGDQWSHLPAYEHGCDAVQREPRGRGAWQRAMSALKRGVRLIAQDYDRREGIARNLPDRDPAYTGDSDHHLLHSAAENLGLAFNGFGGYAEKLADAFKRLGELHCDVSRDMGRAAALDSAARIRYTEGADALLRLVGLRS